jgi:ribonuclease G
VNKELIIRSNSSAVDFALLKDGKLIELNKEVENNKFSVGDIYVAKVTKKMVFYTITISAHDSLL